MIQKDCQWYFLPMPKINCRFQTLYLLVPWVWEMAVFLDIFEKILTISRIIFQVSWVRDRDVHILTAGEQTFTSDQRFSAKHNSEDEWVLLIKYVQVLVIIICGSIIAISFFRKETLEYMSARFQLNHRSHILSNSI